MIKYDEIIHYQSARVNLTKWLLRRIRYKGGMAKETETEEDAPLKYTKFDRVRVVEIIYGYLCEGFTSCITWDPFPLRNISYSFFCFHKLCVY
jgi:hypothetical protein